MSIVDPVFVLCASALAFTVSLILGRFRRAGPVAGTYQSIDGLRGYLALFVFLHHAAIWHVYLTTGQWRLPPSNLFVHLGQGSVSLFFMITAFLFYGKVIEREGREMDWPRFFVGRMLRLAPLYMVMVVVLLGIAAVESHGILADSPRRLLRAVAHWFLFTIFDEAIVNGIGMQQFNAGVNWSLPYEWYFYFSMPLLALTGRVRVPWPWLLAGAAMLAWAVLSQALAFYAAVFACGIAAAFAVRRAVFARFCSTTLASMLACACLVLLVAGFPVSYEYPQLALLAVVFALVAGGADLFGVLSARPSHILGELSYSIYLLHGTLLFVVIRYLAGYEAVRAMSPLWYWGLMYAILLALLVLATATFRLVETPAMQSVSDVMRLLRKRRHPGATVGKDIQLDGANRDMG